MICPRCPFWSFAKFLKIRFIFVFLLMTCRQAFAIDSFFVDPAGDDRNGAGTVDRPWRSLARACRVARKPGTFIYLRAGHYHETSPCKLAPGVSVVGAGLDKTTLRAGFDDWLFQGQSPFMVEFAQRLEGFSIDGDNRSLKGGAIFKNRSNIRVNSVRFSDIDAVALQITGSDGSVDVPPKRFLKDIIIENSHFENCGKDYGKWSGGCLQLGGWEGGRISNNVITEDQGAGIKQWAGGWFRGTRVENNRIRVPNVDTAWGADISIELWNVEGGCVVANNETNGWISIVKGRSTDGLRAVHVVENRILIDSESNVKEGLEIAGIEAAEVSRNLILGAKFAVGLWESRPGTGNADILIHHNVFGGRADGEGIRIHSGDSVRIANNLFFNLEKALGLHTNRNKISDLLFANNLIFKAKHGIVLIAQAAPIEGLRSSTNEYVQVQEPVADWSATKFRTTWRETPSRRVSGDMVISRDGTYKLDRNSPLVDAGTPVELPFCGSSPDIGPAEWCPPGRQ